MLREGSFIAEERRGGGLHGYMASRKLYVGWIHTSIHLMVEFIGLSKRRFCQRRTSIHKSGIGEYSVYKKYIDLWIHSAT